MEGDFNMITNEKHIYAIETVCKTFDECADMKANCIWKDSFIYNENGKIDFVVIHFESKKFPYAKWNQAFHTMDSILNFRNSFYKWYIG